MCLHIYLIIDFDSIIFPKRQKQAFRYFWHLWNAVGSSTCLESVEMLTTGLPVIHRWWLSLPIIVVFRVGKTLSHTWSCFILTAALWSKNHYRHHLYKWGPRGQEHFSDVPKGTRQALVFNLSLWLQARCPLHQLVPLLISQSFNVLASSYYQFEKNQWHTPNTPCLKRLMDAIQGRILLFNCRSNEFSTCPLNHASSSWSHAFEKLSRTHIQVSACFLSIQSFLPPQASQRLCTKVKQCWGKRSARFVSSICPGWCLLSRTSSHLLSQHIPIPLHSICWDDSAPIWPLQSDSCGIWCNALVSIQCHLGLPWSLVPFFHYSSSLIILSLLT